MNSRQLFVATVAFVVLVLVHCSELRGGSVLDPLSGAIPELVADPGIISAVNNDRDSTWTAGVYEQFKGMSIEDLKKRLGADLEAVVDVPDMEIRLHEKIGKLPKSFDARKKWPKHVHPIRNQESCGSCWAFAATEALSDRLSIATKGKIHVVLSPEDMVSCDHKDKGCNGGALPLAWRYLKDSGVVSDRCFPYTAGEGKAARCIHKKCDDVNVKYVKHRTSNYYKVGGRDRGKAEAIMHEISVSGPVEAGFLVYTDFPNYMSGVYSHKHGKLAGGHAIKLLGWGTENGVDYWLCANSWGQFWGDEGYFKIRRGVDECGIESNVYAGEPLVQPEEETVIVEEDDDDDAIPEGAAVARSWTITKDDVAEVTSSKSGFAKSISNPEESSKKGGFAKSISLPEESSKKGGFAKSISHPEEHNKEFKKGGVAKSISHPKVDEEKDEVEVEDDDDDDAIPERAAVTRSWTIIAKDGVDGTKPKGGFAKSVSHPEIDDEKTGATASVFSGAVGSSISGPLKGKSTKKGGFAKSISHPEINGAAEKGATASVFSGAVASSVSGPLKGKAAQKGGFAKSVSHPEEFRKGGFAKSVSHPEVDEAEKQGATASVFSGAVASSISGPLKGKNAKKGGFAKSVSDLEIDETEKGATASVFSGAVASSISGPLKGKNAQKGGFAKSVSHPEIDENEKGATASVFSGAVASSVSGPLKGKNAKNGGFAKSVSHPEIKEEEKGATASVFSGGVASSVSGPLKGKNAKKGGFAKSVSHPEINEEEKGATASVFSGAVAASVSGPLKGKNAEKGFAKSVSHPEIKEEEKGATASVFSGAVASSVSGPLKGKRGKKGGFAKSVSHPEIKEEEEGATAGVFSGAVASSISGPLKGKNAKKGGFAKSASHSEVEHEENEGAIASVFSGAVASSISGPLKGKNAKKGVFAKSVSQPEGQQKGATAGVFSGAISASISGKSKVKKAGAKRDLKDAMLTSNEEDSAQLQLSPEEERARAEQERMERHRKIGYHKTAPPGDMFNEADEVPPPADDAQVVAEESTSGDELAPAKIGRRVLSRNEGLQYGTSTSLSGSMGISRIGAGSNEKPDRSRSYARVRSDGDQDADAVAPSFRSAAKVVSAALRLSNSAPAETKAEQEAMVEGSVTSGFFPGKDIDKVLKEGDVVNE